MDLGAIFILILVLVFILIFVTRPFFVRRRGHSVEKMEKSQKLSTLLAERERLLTAILELDSDQVLEKIPAGNYADQRVELLRRGAEILRQIDGLTERTPGEENAHKEALPGISSPVPVVLSDDELEELLARRRMIRKDKTAGFCPKCGKPVLYPDVFCPSCGYALK
jgi:NADH pyrophosphatase NudC (nudix superfamily)